MIERVCTFGPQKFILLTTHSLSLRPTDEIGKDGWHFFILGRDLDVTKIAQSEQLIFETIASMVHAKVTFNKLVWVTEYRCVRVSSYGPTRVHQFLSVPTSAW